MKIILEQEYLEEAIRNLLQAKGLDLVGKTTTIDFTAGRGPNGASATVEIIDSNTNTVPDGPVHRETEPEPKERQTILFDED